MTSFTINLVRRLHKHVRGAAILALLCNHLATAALVPVTISAHAAAVAPAVTATKTAQLVGDTNGDGKVGPGDTVRYTIGITNTSGTDLTGITLTDPLDAHTALVPGSIHVTPLAYNQALTTSEDIALPVTLTGAQADGQTLTYAVGATPLHGSLSGTAPTLTYTPAANYNGSDSFTFTACNSANVCDTATIIVTITPVNDPPQAVDDSVTVIESSTNNTLDVLANDTAAPDTGETLTITAVGTASKGSVSIANGGTSLIYTPTPGMLGSDIFAYTISDGNGGAATANVTVTITTVNDPPSFTKGGDQTVLEDAGPQTVDPWATAISAGPPDEVGQALTFVVTANTNPSLFSAGPAISPAGVLTYTPAPDAAGSATISVVLRDDGGTANGGNDTSPVQTFTITVTPVNDPPVVNAATFNLNENSANGNAVGTVTFSEPDSGQTHVFSITAGNGTGAFAIDSTTGAITVADSSTLNYETTPSFNLTVQVTDNGVPALSGSATITVNLNDVNEAPAVNAVTFSLNENSANGTAVGTVTFSEPDGGQSHIFSITAGNNSGAFTIDSTTGAITVADSSKLDYETTPSFSLTVQVTDNGTPALGDSATITVNLSDVNEAPVVNAATFSLNENSANGTAVGTVAATDADLPAQTLSYAITAGNASGAFAIDSTSGAITVADSSKLDYETTPSFSLTVQVTDSGTPALSGSATITINLSDVNDAPNVANQTFSIPENSANGTTVGTVAATDPDMPAQTLSFVITAGNASGAFAIDSTSGAITVADSSKLDYETTPSFSLTVQVTDNGTPALSDTATVTVQITDVNDAPVVGSATFAIAENSANSTAVGTVSATDADLPAQTLSFAIIAGNTGGAFAIDSTSGAITVADSSKLDYETTPSFSLTVQVTDNGTPALSGSATITINLSDVNDAPNVANQTFSVPENSANGVAVGTVAATDQDMPAQTLSYAITAGNASGAFAIDSTSGAITVADSSTLDYETTPSFSLTVQVTDNGTPALSSSATITVNLSDVNEAPVVNDQTFTIAENSANTTTVGTVVFNDPDVGQTHAFSITAGNASGAFAINSTTGAITVADSSKLDYETTPSFSLTVQVTDNGVPALSDTAIVTISLTDVNEAPVAAADDYSAVGNTQLRVAGASASAVAFSTSPTNPLDNDTDPDVKPAFRTLSIVAASGTSTKGGTFTINTDGSFVYTPPAGVTTVFGDPDTFTYQLTDGTNTVNGTIRIAVANMVWYVKNNTATAGSAGTSTDPFDTLAEAQAASASGDTIYVLYGDGTTAKQNTGITLKTNQRLLGQGVDLVISSTTLATGNNAQRPLIDNTGGNGVTATTGNTIQGLNLAGSVNAIDLTTSGAASGTVTMTDNTIRSAGIEGIDINAGSSGAVVLVVQNNTISSTGNAFDARTTAGTLQLDFSNNSGITSNATGVLIDGSGGGAVTITGFSTNAVSGNTLGSGMAITSVAFDATPGGTFDQVSGGVTAIGASGNGVGANGMVLTNVSGDLAFTDLDIVADSGAGLRASGTAAYTGSAGLRLGVAAAVATVAATGGPAIDMSMVTLNMPLATLSSVNSATTGVALATVAGSFSAGGGSAITNATGTDFSITSGTADVTYAGSITDDIGQLVAVGNSTAGTKLFSGAITDGNDGDGSGVALTNNTGAAISFTGGLVLSTGANAAFSATGGGTISVTGAANTLATTTGVALTVQNTTIGASGMTFTSISAGTVASGPSSGIVLNNTGAAGGLTVTGTGTTAGSGGTIQKASGDGILLTSARNISLAYMNVTANASNGINVNTVTGLNLTSLSVTNNGNVVNESGIRMTNLFGTNAINGSTVSGSAEDNIYLMNNSGTLNNLTIQGPNCTISNNDPTIGNDGVNIMSTLTANMTVNVDNCRFTGNLTDAIHPDAADTSTLNVTLSNNTIVGGSPNQGNSGIEVTAAASANVTYDVSSNKIGTDGVTNSPLGNTGINIFGGNTSTMSGKVQGNTVVNAGAGISGTGIRVYQSLNSTLRANVNTNTVSNVGSDYGILVQANGGTGSETGRVDVALVGNNASVLSGAIDAIRVQGLRNTTVCGRIASNTTSAGGAGFVGLFLRQANTATFNVEGLTTGSQSAATTKTYEQGQNPAAATVDAIAVTSFTGVAPNSCTIPLMAAGGEGPGSDITPLTQAALDSVVAAALRRWGQAGLSASDMARLNAVAVTVDTLPDGQLGGTSVDTVQIDRTAAGWGWYIDPTPSDDAEFAVATASTERQAGVDGPAHRHMDLLTVVMHELGHVIGKSDLPAAQSPRALMGESLSTGTRRLPPVPASPAARVAAQPQVATFPLAIGTLPAGKHVLVTFDVVVADPLPSSVVQIANQATITGDTIAAVLSDDPATAALNDPTITPISRVVARTVYLPLALRAGLPDLIVERIDVTRSAITVVIRNQGLAPVVDPFWVDAYINPNPAPSHVNQIWQSLASNGAAWGVGAAALPLLPGAALTLTVGDAYYRSDISHLPATIAAGTPIYAQVDSAKANSDYGAVLETHEQEGTGYNNISGPILMPVAVSVQAAPAQPRGAATPVAVPLRPAGAR